MARYRYNMGTSVELTWEKRRWTGDTKGMKENRGRRGKEEWNLDSTFCSCLAPHIGGLVQNASSALPWTRLRCIVKYLCLQTRWLRLPSVTVLTTLGTEITGFFQGTWWCFLTPVVLDIAPAGRVWQHLIYNQVVNCGWLGFAQQDNTGVQNRSCKPCSLPRQTGSGGCFSGGKWHYGTLGAVA